MVEIKKCHVCGSENITSDVRTESSESNIGFVHYQSDKWNGSNGREALHADICDDCGTVRLYVNTTNLKWVGSRYP